LWTVRRRFKNQFAEKKKKKKGEKRRKEETKRRMGNRRGKFGIYGKDRLCKAAPSSFAKTVPFSFPLHFSPISP